MVARISNEIFHVIKGEYLEKALRAKATPPERVYVIDDVISGVNITKCTLKDLDMESPGVSLHLLSMIQDEYNIDMGICPFYKNWYNKRGQQQRCFFNNGPVQVYCSGDTDRCQRHDEFDKYTGMSFEERMHVIEERKQKSKEEGRHK